MSRTRPFRSLPWLVLVASPGLVACSTDGDRSQPDAISTAGVVREGEASEAQLNTFLHRKLRDWDWAGGQFDAPDDHATLAADASPTFAWHADPVDFAQADAPGEVVTTHLLEFSTRSRPRLLQVFTTLPEYTPAAEDWKKLGDESAQIAVSLSTGTFVGTDLPEEGGPFVGQTITFVIE